MGRYKSARNNFIDVTGVRFGKLVAVCYEISPKEQLKPKPRYLWLCRCECGGQIHTDSFALRHRGTQSCGCHRKALTIQRSTIHGQSRTPQYEIWKRLRRTQKRARLSFVEWSSLQKVEVLQDASSTESPKDESGGTFREWNDSNLYRTVGR